MLICIYKNVFKKKYSVKMQKQESFWKKVNSDSDQST